MVGLRPEVPIAHQLPPRHQLINRNVQWDVAKDEDGLLPRAVDQPEPVDSLQHLGLARLIDHSLDAPVGVNPNIRFPPAAVAHGVGALAVRILRLPLGVRGKAADRPLGVVPDCHRPSLGIPGARLLAPQDDHDLVVLELIRPADVAEMGDVGTGTWRADWQAPISILTGEDAAHPLVRYH